MGAGGGFGPHRRAELDLAATVGQFLGHHAVPAGPGVVEREGLALGVGAALTGEDQIGRVFVPRPAGAGFAQADAGGPGGADQVKLADPLAGDVDHLALLRALAGRGRQASGRGLGASDWSVVFRVMTPVGWAVR